MQQFVHIYPTDELLLGNSIVMATMMNSLLGDILFGLTRGVQKFFLERPDYRDLAEAKSTRKARS
jgi:hypothetical protein